jgi:hypothetical protein
MRQEILEGSGMNYYMDCEFNEQGGQIDLISIAIVNDMDRSICVTSSEFDLAAAKAKPWLVENVLAQLPPPELWKTRKEIAADIIAFVGKDPKPRFWAWFASYDWVIFCQLFGGMLNLPNKWPQYVMDLKQEHALAGSPRLPLQMDGQHDALEDAKWNKVVFEILMGSK